MCSYNVVCSACDQVWKPAPKSALWWKAKKHAEQGFLDALHVCGAECGCVEKKVYPEAPYRVFGYDDECRDFNIPCASFTCAAQKFVELNREGMNTVFISGVSETVMERLYMM